jgi:hypothetical protein
MPAGLSQQGCPSGLPQALPRSPSPEWLRGKPFYLRVNPFLPAFLSPDSQPNLSCFLFIKQDFFIQISRPSVIIPMEHQKLRRGKKKEIFPR